MPNDWTGDNDKKKRYGGQKDTGRSGVTGPAPSYAEGTDGSSPNDPTDSPGGSGGFPGIDKLQKVRLFGNLGRFLGNGLFGGGGGGGVSVIGAEQRPPDPIEMILMDIYSRGGIR